jgi:hypothetical protein
MADISTRDLGWDILKVYLDPGQKSLEKDRLTRAPIYTNPYLDATGRIQLKVDVYADCDCEQVGIEVYKTDNLQVVTANPSSCTVIPFDTNTFTLELIIPPNDTSGLYFFFSGCDFGRMPWKTYFVAKQDTVILFEGSSPRDFELAIRKEERRIADSLYRLRTPTLEPQNWVPYEGPTTQVGYFDEDGTFYDRDSLPPGFVKPQPPKKHGRVERPVDTLNLRRPESQWCIIDLREPEDLEFVRTRVESLDVASEIGYYRARLTDSMLEVLRQQSISWQLDSLQQPDREPVTHPDE